MIALDFFAAAEFLLCRTAITIGEATISYATEHQQRSHSDKELVIQALEDDTM